MNSLMENESMVDGRKRSAAFTLIEMLLVIVVLAVLAGLLLPRLHRRGGYRTTCTNNLRLLGFSFHSWSTDNNDLYPMTFYTNHAGEMLFANASNAFRTFLVMSNEINNPKFLLCPEDKKRMGADTFMTNFSGANTSYFLGLDADETRPSSLLSGDRNIMIGSNLASGILAITTNQTLSWTKERHQGNGNILLSDGSVQQVTSQGLQSLVAQSGLATNRLAMP